MAKSSAERVAAWRQRTGARRDVARRRAEMRAAKWVREQFPEVWERLFREALNEEGLR